MSSDDHLYLDANVDFAKSEGFFVRIDVEIPMEAVTTGLPGPDDDVPHGSLRLSPERAEIFATRILEMAAGVRAADQRWKADLGRSGSCQVQ